MSDKSSEAAARDGVEPQHEVDDERLALAALVLEDAVVAPALQPGQGELVVMLALLPVQRSASASEHPQGVAAGAYVVHPEPPHPRPGQDHA